MTLHWPITMKEIGRVDIDGRHSPIMMDGSRERIEVETPAGPAVLTYELVGHALDLMHTVVPEPHRGHGVGEALARAALDYARHERLTVRPSCFHRVAPGVCRPRGSRVRGAQGQLPRVTERAASGWAGSVMPPCTSRPVAPITAPED
jgi:predicted GNAT family acetyltransferase